MAKIIRGSYSPDDPIYQNSSWTIYVPKGLKPSNSKSPGEAQAEIEIEQPLSTTNAPLGIEEGVVDKKWKKYVTPAQMKNDYELFRSYYPGLTWEEFEEFIENYISD